MIPKTGSARSRARILTIIACVAMSVPTTAVAQEAGEAVTDEAIELAKEAHAAEDREDGWKLGLSLAGTVSFLHSSLVVGQENGVTLQFGGVARTHANLTWGNHEWRNNLSLEHLQTKTPSIEPFLKSADMLEAQTLYLYRLPFLDWIGPYARARAFTPIFPGEGVPADDVTLRRVSPDGTFVDEFATGQKAFLLTSWLEPLTIAESVGAFAEPLSLEQFTVSAKLGVGGQHVIVRDGYVVSDDAATPELELAALQTVHSAGVEGEIGIKGVFIPDRLSWGGLANVYYPILISVPTELDAFEVTHLDLTGNISFKITEGISLDYLVRARRQPFVLNDWQVQNSVLLTLGLSVL